MKDGYITDTSGVPNEQELAQINRLARRKLSADEVFVFSVVLCDNEIDRDFERFSVKALHTMARLFVGKTGLFDHSMKGRDQVARIFACEVEEPGGQATRDGKPYVRLKARAYMPKTEKNRELITEIDAGIKKEVSVGCAVGQVVCSVCGADQRHDGCEHQKGRVYHRNGADTICHHVLNQPTDAYEWSFVAVPAQPAAGVVKAFSGGRKGGNDLQATEIVKSLAGGREITLSAAESAALADWIGDLQKQAEAGAHYEKAARQEIVRLGLLAQPELDAGLMEKMISGLDGQDLPAMKEALVKQLDGRYPPRSQFESRKPEDTRPQHQYDTFVI